MNKPLFFALIAGWVVAWWYIYEQKNQFAPPTPQPSPDVPPLPNEGPPPFSIADPINRRLCEQTPWLCPPYDWRLFPTVSGKVAR